MSIVAKTHREQYPDQYTHPLCGKRVHVKTHTGFETDGTVERVVNSRFGQIAMFEGDNTQGWLVRDCTIVS